MWKILGFLVLVVFSSVNSFNVVEQISPKDVSTRSRNATRGRIVNGVQADVNQFPYQVWIRAINGKSVSFCGGSILSRTYILTAAHCTKGFQKFEIGFGSNTLKQPLFRLTAYLHLEHPQFTPKTLNNDIALIKLPVSIPLSGRVAVVELPRFGERNSTFVGDASIVSGFGRVAENTNQVSQVLNFARMQVVDNAVCLKLFGSKIVTNSVICAKGQESKDQNACLGDSGGPLVIRNERGPVQVGIVSFVSSRGCDYGDPSGYTRVTNYLEWISHNTGVLLRR